MSKTRMIGGFCLCCLLVVLLAPAGAAGAPNPYENAIKTARSEIWKAINSGRCASATTAIMVDGKIVYAEGFGMANREKSTPVGPGTLFNIGSISKVHVAAAIMLLVDDGKVSLDQPVTAYLPEFKMADDRYKQITVRMLLNHVSGMPGTEGSNSFGFTYDDRIKQETIRTLARAHLKHAPGALAVYCNDGFTLAEMIVERVSKKKYIDFLRARIFKPLGLRNTGMGVGEIKGKPIALYYEAKTGKVHPPETLSILGAGGLSSTAMELCFFMDAFSAKGKLFKEASLAEMKKAQPPTLQGGLRNPQISCGLGWDMTSLPRYAAVGLQVLGKSGGTGDYSSMVYTVPDKRISVAFIAAGSHSGAMKIALDILDAVLVGKKLVPQEEKTLSIPPEAQKLPQDAVSFSGYYANGGSFGQIVFDAEQNRATLYSFEGRQKTQVATLIYHNGYYYDPENSRYYFATIGGETYWASCPLPGIDMITMQKIKPIAKPQSLKIDLDGNLWLRRNVSPYESIMAVDSHFVKSFLYADLPGYVYFNGIKRIDSPQFAGMPFDAMRDQTELTLLDQKGATWAWISDMLYSPAAQSAVAFKGGENTVKIGGDGYNEWLAVNEGMVVSFTKPQRGRIIVISSDDRATYDSALDTGDAYAAKGSYIEFAGFANDTFTVRAKPAAAGEKK